MRYPYKVLLSGQYMMVIIGEWRKGQVVNQEGCINIAIQVSMVALLGVAAFDPYEHLVGYSTHSLSCYKSPSVYNSF